MGERIVKNHIFTLVGLIFTATVLIALCFGYFGLGQYSRWHHLRSSPADLVYNDLQLFVLSSDLVQNGPAFPWSLEVARFAAPTATTYALLESGRLLFAAELRRLRARTSRGHSIVCGDTPTGRALAQRLRARGDQVVMVTAQDGAPPTDTLTVRGDPRDPAVLRRCGVGAARAVYSCSQDSAANLAVVLATAELTRRSGGPLRIYAQMFDPYLSAALRARTLGRTGPATVRVDFFHTDELAARAFFRAERLPSHRDRPPRIVVVDMTAFGRAIVVEAARQWRAQGGLRGLDVTVVDRRAGKAVEDMKSRYPFVGDVCSFHIKECATVEDYLATVTAPDWPPDLAFLCGEDEESTLRAALTDTKLWHGGPRELVVRLDSVARLGDAARRRGEYARLLDPAGGHLSVVGVVESGCDPDLIDEDLVESLAQAIHEDYVSMQRQRGCTMRSSPSMMGWEQLSVSKRAANRAQARHIGSKLRQIGCLLVPRTRAGLFEPREDEVESLAVAEHDRWRAERLADGWVWGPKRDEAAKHHPDLVPWSELGTAARNKDRAAVRELPRILSNAGFDIVRFRPAPAVTRSQPPEGTAAPGSGRPGRGPRWPC